jgi:Carboxypeptidase regulatory-like domain
MRIRNLLRPMACLVIALSLPLMTAAAQSGRSWMNGIVFDESDTHGISGARVELIGDPDDPRLQSTKLTTNTDERGKYAFSRVPYGGYTFRVSAAGFTTYEIKLYIASDALTALHVQLKKRQ